MNIKVNRKLVIPSSEIRWRFSRSSGPGGQNVNKLETRVEIIFNIQRSNALSTYQKENLFDKLNNQIIDDSITISVQERRTQFENRQLAIDKLTTLIKDKLFSETKVRKVTTPTKASQRKRIQSKKKRGELKQNRKKNLIQDL